MTEERDIAAFGKRARGYEDGWLGRFHQEIAERVASIALSAQPAPDRILDVGCGTGYLLRLLATRCPHASALCGVDPAPAMATVARQAATDVRLRITEARAERLPYPDAEFDLVVSTTSFDHWQDQAAGLAECRRVLDRDGVLVLADVFSPLLMLTLVGTRRGKARTRPRAARLLSAAGLRVVEWHRVYPLIGAVTARR